MNDRVNRCNPWLARAMQDEISDAPENFGGAIESIE